MFRCAISAVRFFRPLAVSYCNAARLIRTDIKPLSTNCKSGFTSTLGVPQQSLVNNGQILAISNHIAPAQVRTVTKFSLKKGKRKTVKAALRRFYRLDWGAWIRPRIGRHKKLWKKTHAQKRRLRQHVLCNNTQSVLLDKMVTKFWKRPKYYVDNPYAPYHKREEFYITRRSPAVRE